MDNDFSARRAFPPLVPKLTLLEECNRGLADALSSSRALDAVNSENPAGIRFLVYLLSCKALKSLRAIQTLFEKGYPEDACILLRGVWETFVNILYLKQDPITRVPLYMNFAPVIRHKLHEASKNYYGKSAPPEVASEIQADHDRVKSDYTRNSWSRTAVRDRAKAVGFQQWQYDIVYAQHSHMVHGDVASLDRYLKKSGDGVVVCLAPKSPEDYMFFPTEATTYAIGLLEQLNDSLVLGLESALQSYIDQMSKMPGAEPNGGVTPSANDDATPSETRDK